MGAFNFTINAAGGDCVTGEAWQANAEFVVGAYNYFFVEPAVENHFTYVTRILPEKVVGQDVTTMDFAVSKAVELGSGVKVGFCDC